MIRYIKLSLCLIALVLIGTACAPSPQVQPTSTTGLPLPQNVTDAVLVNFRPLTLTGRALGAVWAPNGKSLAYSELSFVPNLRSYHLENSQPESSVWVTSPEGTNSRMLDRGVALFFGKDSSDIYYQWYDPGPNTPSLYAYNLTTNKPRHFLGTEGFPSVTKLADGRLVLGAMGTHAPLRIFDPVTGNRQALMDQHPSIIPQNARLSPDGSLLAYPDLVQIFMSKPDGSSPKVIESGGGSAKVWWSPDSQYLVLTTGSLISDRLLLANRQGEILATFIRAQGESGYVSSVEWSPDSRRLLVTTEGLQQNARPSRLYLFDLKGNFQLLLESFFGASPAWSPDGSTLALSFWIGVDSEEPSFDIWLADLTDKSTAAALPSSSTPQPKPSPTLLVLPQEITAEQVVYRFWATIKQKDYHAAWSMFSESGRKTQEYLDFKAFYECFSQVSVTNVEKIQGDDQVQAYKVKIDYQGDPTCNENWVWTPDFYTLMVKTAADIPWQIECLNTSANCDKTTP